MGHPVVIAAFRKYQCRNWGTLAINIGRWLDYKVSECWQGGGSVWQEWRRRRWCAVQTGVSAACQRQEEEVELIGHFTPQLQASSFSLSLHGWFPSCCCCCCCSCTGPSPASAVMGWGRCYQCLIIITSHTHSSLLMILIDADSRLTLD